MAFSSDDFVEELGKRRPEIYEKKNEQHLKDIIEYIKPLTPETRSTLLTAVLDNFKVATRCLTRADLIDCAEKAKLHIKKIASGYYYNHCTVCKIKYSLMAGGCPECKKKTVVTVGISNKKPNNFIEIREDCWCCMHYGKYSIGINCQEYGTGAHKELCEKCICKNCCNEYHLLKTDYQRYRELMKAGKLEKRWR